MKRALALLLVLSCIALAACSKGNDAPSDATPAPEATENAPDGEPEPTVEPEPTATPEPVALTAPADFTYTESSNQTLGMSYKIPSHWTVVYGRRTLCYEEPTTEGVVPARVAISAASVTSAPDAVGMQAQMTRFTDLLKDEYDAVTLLEYKDGVKLMGISGYRQTYTATVGTQEVSGYVIISYVAASSKVYLVHFSAPTARYDELGDVRDEIRKSILPL